MERLRIDIQITPQACIFAAAALLILPLRWLAAMSVAAFFHEVCHMAALCLCGVEVDGLYIGLCGAQIRTGPVSIGRELLCALAGPAGSFLLMLVSSVFPEAAFCGMIQGVFNLIPIYPSDGGRALRCLLEMLFPHRGRAIFSGVEVSVCIILLGLLIAVSWILRWHFGILFAGAFLLHRILGRKIPCKAAHKRVQ